MMLSQENDLERELHTAPRVYRLPPGRIVRRARERYLYDQKGERYLDVWLSDGAAFLGHRPRGYGRLIKEETDRGLWGPFPSQWPVRLGKALRELTRAARLPEGEIRLINGRYSHLPGADAIRWLPLGGDLLTGGAADASSDGQADGASHFSAGDGAAAVAVRASTAGDGAPARGVIELLLPVPGVIIPRDMAMEELPAAATALLTRGAHALTGYLSRDERHLREEVAAGLPEPPGYRRAGVWFLPNVGGYPDTDREARWERTRNDALSLGIILPPDPWTPLVIPDGMNSADRRNWERMCHGWTR